MTAGVCRYCGVTDDQVDGNKLSWHDAERTCCSKYACVKKHHSAARIAQRQEQDQAREQQRKYGDRYRGWGLGAIIEDLRKRKRAASR